jgi:hypothetical protein
VRLATRIRSFGIDAGAIVCFELQFRLRIVLRRHARYFRAVQISNEDLVRRHQHFGWLGCSEPTDLKPYPAALDTRSAYPKIELSDVATRAGEEILVSALPLDSSVLRRQNGKSR